MVTMRKTWIYAAVAFTLGYLLIGARPLSALGDCKLVLDAMTKVVSTPTHLYATMNFGGKNQAVETIYAGGGIYTRLDGKWSRSPMTMQDMAELQQGNLHNNNAKPTCKYLKDELVNGEMTALYSTHDVSPKRCDRHTDLDFQVEELAAAPGNRHRCRCRQRQVPHVLTLRIR